MKGHIWLKRLAKTTASMAALAVLAPAPSFAQDKLSGTTDTADDTEGTEKALFGLYPDLNTKATLQRLAELEKSPETAKALALVSDMLADPSTKPADIEAYVMKLIYGQKLDASEMTLNAVMRDYYNHHVVGSTENKAMEAISAELVKVDDVLTSAAYGTQMRAASDFSGRIRRVRIRRR